MLNVQCSIIFEAYLFNYINIRYREKYDGGTLFA